jgi:hypothetical protein
VPSIRPGRPLLHGTARPAGPSARHAVTLARGLCTSYHEARTGCLRALLKGSVDAERQMFWDFSIALASKRI